MFHDLLQVAPRTGPEKIPVYYAHDSDGCAVILKRGLSDAEVTGLLKTEHIKELLGLPRTHVRRLGHDGIIAQCLYDYNVKESHVCRSGIDRGMRISNIKLKQWLHNVDDCVTIRSFFKALAFRQMIGTDDTVPRNFVLIGQTVYSVDDPAWEIEPTRVWKVKTHSEHYNQLLDEHWEWVLAFLIVWEETPGLSEFNYRMIGKMMRREYWKF